MIISARVRTLVLWGLLDPIPRLAAAQASSQGSSPQPATYQVSGVVMDSARAPIPEVEVTVMGVGAAGRPVVTGADGRFTIPNLASSRVALRVRRIGYVEQMVDVRQDGDGRTTSVEIVLRAVPTRLEEVVVNPETPGRLREFYERRRQRHSFARFLELADIRRLAPTNSSELFRTVPGITIRASSTGGNTIRIRGCQPTVWVDGQRIPGAELDDVVQPNDIGGIEFYPSSAGIPPQYLDPTNRLCGLILVWTRSL